MHLLVILKHTVLLSDVERKQGTRSLVSICQLGRQMLQMGQRRSLADSPNGTDVKMGGEGGGGGGGDKSLSSTIPLFSTHGYFHWKFSRDHFVCLFPVHPFGQS